MATPERQAEMKVWEGDKLYKEADKLCVSRFLGGGRGQRSNDKAYKGVESREREAGPLQALSHCRMHLVALGLVPFFFFSHTRTFLAKDFFFAPVHFYNFV
jgi:hypothetical protein